MMMCNIHKIVCESVYRYNTVYPYIKKPLKIFFQISDISTLFILKNMNASQADMTLFVTQWNNAKFKD